MNERILLFCQLIAFSLFLSCNKEDEVFTNQKTAINIYASINSTKSIKSTWSEGDSISVFIIKRSHDPSCTERTLYLNNHKFVSPSGDNQFISQSKSFINFPENDSKIDVFAYYPYIEDVNSQYLINLKDQEKTEVIDILFSDNVKEIEKKTSEISLKFTPILCKLSIHIMPDNELTENDLKESTALLSHQSTYGILFPN